MKPEEKSKEWEKEYLYWRAFSVVAVVDGISEPRLEKALLRSAVRPLKDEEYNKILYRAKEIAKNKGISSFAELVKKVKVVE